MSEDKGTQDKRSTEEIEAELARTRMALTDTVNELSGRLDPRAQVEAAKEAATEKARTFADDVQRKDPKALATVGAAVAAVVLIAVLRGRH